MNDQAPSYAIRKCYTIYLQCVHNETYTWQSRQRRTCWFISDFIKSWLLQCGIKYYGALTFVSDWRQCERKWTLSNRSSHTWSNISTILSVSWYQFCKKRIRKFNTQWFIWKQLRFLDDGSRSCSLSTVQQVRQLYDHQTVDWLIWRHDDEGQGHWVRTLISYIQGAAK